MDLYEKHPAILEIEDILRERKKEATSEKLTWRSFNFSRMSAYECLKTLEIR